VLNKYPGEKNDSGKAKVRTVNTVLDKNTTHVELSTKCNGKHGEYIYIYIYTEIGYVYVLCN
jgi:hypothetical protein